MSRNYLAYYENEWPVNITELTAIENKPFVGYLKGTGVLFTVIPKPVTGPADNEIWYTTSDNNKLTWWALDYVPTEQIVTLGGDGGESVYYTPGEPGYERIYGYNVLYHDFDKDKNCFVLKFDKPVTEAFWKFGDSFGAGGGGAACGQNITSFILPNSVNYIMEFAFYSCESLTSITIPNSVTSIGDGAFRYCSSLTSITIPNSVTSIGDGAFRYCSSLASMTIPNSVTSIGAVAFYDCSGLTSITYEGTQEQWNAITKGPNWVYGVPATYVQCTDGQVSL